jgi:hypothetical protein
MLKKKMFLTIRRLGLRKEVRHLTDVDTDAQSLFGFRQETKNETASDY